MDIGTAIDDRIGMVSCRIIPERNRHGERGVSSECDVGGVFGRFAA